jgi:histidyl-tRNA synthetase
MTGLRPVRGTHDIVGEEALRHRKVLETGRAVAARYGYHEVGTPVFEFTEVVARTLGETSDVVTKEMYTSRTGAATPDRMETSPASRARSYPPARPPAADPLFASGPMFRYERPQKGGCVSSIRSTSRFCAPEPLADVEVIALRERILLSRPAGAVTLELNSPRSGEPAACCDELVGFWLATRRAVRGQSRPARA